MQKVASDTLDTSDMYLSDKSNVKPNAQQHNFSHKAGSRSGITFYDVI